MPFVNISLARGKSAQYLEAVSNAVHEALVAELNMKPEDNFQLIHQHDPADLIFHRTFRGGPRSDDWIMLTIIDGLERGERVKRRFYATLIRLLQDGAGVRPADVFVIMTSTLPENFSFAGGVMATDVVAGESLDAAAKDASARIVYRPTELTYAVRELFEDRDSSRILPMLRDDFVMRIPASLPYGGAYYGRQAFGSFFAGTPGGSEVWESFEVSVDGVINAGDHIVARLTNTAVPISSGRPVDIENLWFFKVANGQFVSAQLYADTAAACCPVK